MVRPRKDPDDRSPGMRRGRLMRRFRCTSCGLIKFADEFGPASNGGLLRPVKHHCHECINAANRALNFQKRMGMWEPPPPRPTVPEGMKFCSRCEQAKPRDEFYRTSTYCKPCHKAYMRPRSRARWEQEKAAKEAEWTAQRAGR